MAARLRFGSGAAGVALLGLAAGGALVPVFAGARPAVAAPPRPVVVIFLGGVPDGVKDENDLYVARTRAAARALRDTFADTNVADPVLYSPDAPTFVRALLEAKLKPATAYSLTEAEKVALGKAVGATYVLTVFTHELPEKAQSAGTDIEMHAVEVATKKSWSKRQAAFASPEAFRAAITPAGTEAQPDPSAPTIGGPAPAAPSQSRPTASNALLSAANTLVTHFLAGPMVEYARTSTPPSLLPPAAPPPTVAATDMPPLAAPVTPPVPAPTHGTPPVGPAAPAPVVLSAPTTAAPAPATAPSAAPAPAESSQAATDEQAAALLLQGEQLTTAGDAPAAVLALRKAVNLAPMSLPTRAALIRAYTANRQFADAMAEAKRALNVAHPEDRAGRLQITRMMADALKQQGDTKAARALYEQVVAAQPATATWARLALGDIAAAEGDNVGAESLYREVLKAEPASRDAHLGLARALAAKGDYDGALQQMTEAQPADAGSDAALTRYSTARSLFDDGVLRIAGLLRQNRAASAKRTLGRETFFKVTNAQSERVTSLLKLLKAVPPPLTAGEATEKAHRRRIFAASLLSQALAESLAGLETGKPDADEQADVFLNEFDREMAEAGAKATAPAPPGKEAPATP